MIDDLSTGTRVVVPDDVPFYEGDDRRPRRWSTRIFAEQGIGAIMHFAGSIVVPESVENPLDYYATTLASHALIVGRGGRRRAAFRLLLDRRGVRRARACADRPRAIPKQPINPYGASKLMTERMLADAAAAYPLNYAALRYFNVAGADPQGAPASRQGLDPSDQGRGRGGGRASATMSMCSAPTIRRPTAPACATISMSAILPTPMSPRSSG